jgi:hypothetical protein
MLRVILVIAFVLALAGGWWRWHSPTHPAPVKASIYETDMTEHLVREILAAWPPPAPPVCFLAFGDGSTSPSPAFIARLADSRPAVRSCGSSVAPPTGQFFETSTGRPGQTIHIISFKELIPGTFDVRVGFSNLPPGHDQFTYRISKVGGEWKIESQKPA